MEDLHSNKIMFFKVKQSTVRGLNSYSTLLFGSVEFYTVNQNSKVSIERKIGVFDGEFRFWGVLQSNHFFFRQITIMGTSSNTYNCGLGIYITVLGLWNLDCLIVPLLGRFFALPYQSHSSLAFFYTHNSEHNRSYKWKNLEHVFLQINKWINKYRLLLSGLSLLISISYSTRLQLGFVCKYFMITKARNNKVSLTEALCNIEGISLTVSWMKRVKA